MRTLAVAETVGAIDPTFLDMHEHGKPGFQVGPDVSLDDCLAALERYMQEQLGFTSFSFDVAFGNHRPQHAVVVDTTSPDTVSGAGFSPHIDEKESERHVGIALHHNVQGTGRVVLQATRAGTTELPEDGGPLNWRRRLVTAGPKYTGELVPGTKTIFSEGLVTIGGLYRVRIGPAIHGFTSGEDGRLWTRYTPDWMKPLSRDST